LIDLLAERGVVVFQSTVSIPGAGAAVAAVEDLHESHALFNQPAGHQALPAELLRLFAFQTIERLRRGGFSRDVDHAWHGRLHVEGQLVALDPGPQRRVVRILDGRQPVQPGQQLKFAALLLAKDILPRSGERQRIFGVDAQLHAAVLGAEIVGAVGADTAAAIGDGSAQDDEAGQIVVQRSQAIVNPGAERGKLTLEHVAPGVKLQLRAVVVVGCPDRADHGQVVGTGTQVREPAADFQSALAAFLESHLHRK